MRNDVYDITYEIASREAQVTWLPTTRDIVRKNIVWFFSLFTSSIRFTGRHDECRCMSVWSYVFMLYLFSFSSLAVFSFHSDMTYLFGFLCIRTVFRFFYLFISLFYVHSFSSVWFGFWYSRKWDSKCYSQCTQINRYTQTIVCDAILRYTHDIYIFLGPVECAARFKVCMRVLLLLCSMTVNCRSIFTIVHITWTIVRFFVLPLTFLHE